MKRSLRTVILILAALAVMSLVLVGLIFLLAGDQLLEFGRTVVLRATLALREDELNSSVGDDPSPIRFTVHSGDNASTIASRLEEQGFVEDSGLFADYVQFKELDVELEAGTYFLNKTMNIKQIAVALTDSSLSQIELTIFPGERMEQVAERIDESPLFAFSGADFLLLVGKGAEIDAGFAGRMGIPRGASLEGFLFPDTYSLPPETNPLMLRDILLEAFESTVSDALRTQTSEQGYSLYEMVTLASIIEREAIFEEEHARISSVYRNRLEAENGDWRLQADPTVQYAIGAAGNWWPHLTTADYDVVISDYNTYITYGLPPGPIASPGLSAITAAINPENTGYFFFRADCRRDGYHDFSETFNEHLYKC